MKLETTKANGLACFAWVQKGLHGYLTRFPSEQFCFIVIIKKTDWKVKINRILCIFWPNFFIFITSKLHCIVLNAFLLLSIWFLHTGLIGLGDWTTLFFSNKKYWVKASWQEKTPHIISWSHLLFQHFGWEFAYRDRLKLLLGDDHTHVHTRRSLFGDDISGADFTTQWCCCHTKWWTSWRQYSFVHNLEQFCIEDY